MTACGDVIAEGMVTAVCGDVRAEGYGDGGVW